MSCGCTSVFGVSFRDVEELMAARGVLVSYETVRRWCDKFGHQFAAGLRRRRARTGDKWHLDEVFSKRQWREAVPVAGR
jgi:putative transposase